MGARLSELGWIPELVVSSNAARTRETWRRMSDAFGGNVEVRFTARLYHAGLRLLREQVKDGPAELCTPLGICHNPGREPYTSQNTHLGDQDIASGSYTLGGSSIVIVEGQ